MESVPLVLRSCCEIALLCAQQAQIGMNEMAAGLRGAARVSNTIAENMERAAAAASRVGRAGFGVGGAGGGNATVSVPGTGGSGAGGYTSSGSPGAEWTGA